MTRKPLADPENLARQFILARREMHDAEARMKAIQEQLLTVMPTTKYTVDLGGGDSAALTVVASVRRSWIPSRVKALLPVKHWNRVREDAVNKEILEAMIASGELAAFDLSSCQDMTESKPYLRVTEKPRSTTNVFPLTQKESA